MAKQSREDRLRRLNRGGCPIHGIPMGQVDVWYESPKGDYTIVACPRGDCNIKAKMYLNEQCELLSQFSNIIEDTR